MSLSSPLVLITGVTGFVGFHTMLKALEAGYSVRAAVRNDAKRDTIINCATIKALDPGDRLQLIIIPDIMSKNACNMAIKDCTYVIHIASPLVNTSIRPEHFQSELIDPAVKGTINMLEAAKQTPSVKRVVITSSAMAIVPWKHMSTEPTDRVFTSDDRTTDLKRPFDNVFEAYGASKIAALNEAEIWMARETPAFDAIHVAPSIVFGRDQRAVKSADLFNGSNAMLLSIILGTNPPFPIAGHSCDIDDVAQVHVRSLDAKVSGNQTFLVIGKNPDAEFIWQDATKYTAELFPESVEKGVLPNNGVQQTVRNTLDATKTEQIFGRRLKGLKEQINDLIGQYLELSGN